MANSVIFIYIRVAFSLARFEEHLNIKRMEVFVVTKKICYVKWLLLVSLLW